MVSPVGATKERTRSNLGVEEPTVYVETKFWGREESKKRFFVVGVGVAQKESEVVLHKLIIN